jgi:hypothetical protein
MMSRKKPPAPSTAVEPFAAWWAKHLERVNKSASDAERHLEIPAGTISAIPDDPDFIATVKTYAVVEPLLNEMITAKLPGPKILGMSSSPKQNESFRTFVAALSMSGRTSKLGLAEALGLLTKSQIGFIEALARVRNRYAHNVKNMHRSLAEILAEEQKSNQHIMAQLTGIRTDLYKTLSSDSGGSVLSSLMYYRLTDFLAGALDTLRPPPPPSGGLFGGLLSEPDASENE